METMNYECDETGIVDVPVCGLSLKLDSAELGGMSEERVRELIEEAVTINHGGFLLCEFYFFRHPTLRPGFQRAHGDVIVNASSMYPRAWAYLQTSEGQMLCKSEEEWQAMSHDVWASLADGTDIGWQGIGGVPYYVVDDSTGSLRLPDLRGMNVEAAGFDSLEVGGVHGDGMRRLTAQISGGGGGNWGPSRSAVGMARVDGAVKSIPAAVSNISTYNLLHLDSEKQAPTANKMQTRSWGALACVYLGHS